MCSQSSGSINTKRLVSDSTIKDGLHAFGHNMRLT